MHLRKTLPTDMPTGTFAQRQQAVRAMSLHNAGYTGPLTYSTPVGPTAALQGLGAGDQKQKIADFFDNLSHTIRGEKQDDCSLTGPCVQKILVIAALGFVGYKVLEAVLRNRR